MNALCVFSLPSHSVKYIRKFTQQNHRCHEWEYSARLNLEYQKTHWGENLLLLSKSAFMGKSCFKYMSENLLQSVSSLENTTASSAD